MSEDLKDQFKRDDEKIKYRIKITPTGKINTLLTELLEKEEEITLYKNRLEELEKAFYYNLELLSERDFEISILEEQLGAENVQLQDLINERNELENIVKAMNDKTSKKIKQLETRLSVKEEEIKDLQRQKMANVNSFKKHLDDMKQLEEKKILKINTKFDTQTKELIKGFQEEIEEKEKYYLLQIDDLAGKLAQECLEKEELAKAGEVSKNQLEEMKKLLQEKESVLEELKKKRNVPKTDSFVQCDLRPQVLEQIIQTQSHVTSRFCQTIEQQISSALEKEYAERLNFLQEQNEVLKYIVKDLKRNRDFRSGSENPRQLPGCECSETRAEIEKVNKKFENEINNLKGILEEEKNHRADEDVVIERLESSVTCLKDKLLSGLQEKLTDCEGDDICSYMYNREIQNEIQATLLEHKLSKKMDSFITAAEENTKKVHKKIKELQKECVETMEKYLKPKEEFPNENLLQKIRTEIHKLEYKIESDVKNIVKNNLEKNKCDVNSQMRVEYPEEKQLECRKASLSCFPEILPPKNEFVGDSLLREFACRNDLPREKCVIIPSVARQGDFKSPTRKRVGERREIKKVTNQKLRR